MSQVIPIEKICTYSQIASTPSPLSKQQLSMESLRPVMLAHVFPLNLVIGINKLHLSPQS